MVYSGSCLLVGFDDITTYSVFLPVQTRQAAVPEPGPAGAAAGAVVGAPLRPHQAHLGVASRLALTRLARQVRSPYAHIHYACESTLPSLTLTVLPVISIMRQN